MTSEEALAICAKIKYRDWTLHANSDEHAISIYWTGPVKCVETGLPAMLTSKTVTVSLQHATAEFFLIQSLLLACGMEIHECYEHFNYEGVRVFNPHVIPQEHATWIFEVKNVQAPEGMNPLLAKRVAA